MTTLAKWTSISFTSRYLGVCSERPPRCHSGGRALQPQWSGSIVTLHPRSQTDLSELSSRLLKQTASLPPCDPASVNMIQTDVRQTAQMWRGQSELHGLITLAHWWVLWYRNIRETPILPMKLLTMLSSLSFWHTKENLNEFRWESGRC